MEQGEGLTKKFNIPISHLDFDYIGKCKDIKELEKIYLTLKNGEEGKYLELEAFCEENLKKICPESRVLRRPTELKTTEQLDREQKEQLTQDFQTWLTDIQISEKNMIKLEPTEKGDGIATTKYPIRGKQTMIIEEEKINQSDKKKTNKLCKPKDYNEWSKIADQLEKQMIIEETEEQNSTPEKKKEPKPETEKCDNVPNLTSKVDTYGLSEIEKTRLALTEKDKGNEAFRAGDLEEANIYYCRSLSIHPCIPVYNNRGLIYMKQKRWEKAIRDFNTVIKSEPSNVKALMRRASCYSEIHNLQDAIIDCEKVLKLSPNNKAADTLLTKSQDELQKRAQPKLKDGRRMVITEVGSDDEESENEDTSDKIAPIVVENENVRKEERNVSVISETNESKIMSNEDKSEQSFTILKDKGNELFKELRYEEALSVYDQLTERWPSNPIGYRNKAACNLLLEKFDEVIKDCSIAIDLDKSSHLSFYRRGKAYKVLKQYKDSLPDLEEALRISPSHKQINDELNEVKSLIHDEMIASAMNDEEVTAMCSSNQSSIHNDNTEIITETSITDLQRSSPMSGTWEFLETCDLQTCSKKHEEMENSVIVVEDPSKELASSVVPTIERSITCQMTKYEFDKKINSIKMIYVWSNVIQLLVDATPDDLVSLMGEKLDGTILDHIISSLLVYSSNSKHTSFILCVLDQLTKMSRFGFVKMMVSDYTVSELEQLFMLLKKTCDNLALVDTVQLKYL